MRTDFFRSTPDALRGTFVGWREPLSVPVQRRVHNPFTRELIDVWTWDPSPEIAIAPFATDEPPSPSIDMAGFELFGVLSLLDVFLPERAALLRAEMFPAGVPQTSGRERRPAIVGPEDGPFVWSVPPPLVARLAEMSEADVAEGGPRWAAAFRIEEQTFGGSSSLLGDPFYTDGLRRFAAFAREAQAVGEFVFEWVVIDQ